ncbi:MAG: enoyl-CoA hydratase/isomerase family protein [Chloroflexi bacterium]|nr:enoyl-CoA hydratase/isomerase family protein [Chloroflexota bacterium]
MTRSSVLLEKRDAIARIVLNRPAMGNAIDAALAHELRDACRDVVEDDDVTVAVITGAGRSFCQGSAGVSDLTPDVIAERQVACAIADIPKPTIAAMNGDALGQGLELALACDLRVAAEGARLGLTQILEGTMPWDGGTQRLPRTVPRGIALEMVLTGKTIDAREALAIGLVTRVAAPEELDATVGELAAKLAASAPIAGRYAKEAIHQGMDLPLSHALRLEADLAVLLHTSSDRSEGIRAFLEKRTPRFKGG